MKTKMALKVDDVSTQLAYKFTNSSFDPEKCKAGKITRNLIIVIISSMISFLLISRAFYNLYNKLVSRKSSSDLIADLF